MSKETHQKNRSRKQKVEPSTNNFGARLRSLIDRKGLSLVEFSEQFPLSESNLHNWLKRSAPPLEKHWPKLAQFFGVSQDYIAYGTPNLSEPSSRRTLADLASAHPKVAMNLLVAKGTELSWRINTAAENAGLPPDELAGKMGVTVERVSEWLTGKRTPRAREMRDLARLLQVQHDWLALGEGSRLPEALEEPAAEAEEVRQVPVISWSHAGTASTYEEMSDHWRGRVATTSRDRRAFAVTIEGDCMEPKFFAGDRVVLEPQAPLVNGKPVVAKLADDAVQLRIYTRLTDGSIRLTTLKPDIYPSLDYKLTDFHWIYPVRELVRSV